jgi:signal transduction histidine kinase
MGVVRLWNPNKTILGPFAREGLLHPERLQAYSAIFLDQNRATLVSQALSRRRTAVEENVQRREGLEVLRAEGVEVAVAVPVIAENEILGVLLLGSRSPRKLDANLVRLIETIGNQLGLAVQKIRFQQETQHNLERVKGLYEINRATTSTLELNSVLDLLLEKIVSIHPRSAAGIRLFNKQRGVLEPAACRNLDEANWKSLGKSPPGHLSGLVFNTMEPVVVSNMPEDPRAAHLQLFRQEGLISFLGIPLIAKGEKIGVLMLYTRVRHDFTDEEITYVSALADQAAIAIQNSQLYEEARKLSRGLLASRSQIRTLMSGIVKAKDEEARRIARELHDESGQLLAAVHISLGEMAKNLPAEFGHQIRQTKELLKQVENRLRDLSHELHPSVLDDLGLVPGLEFLAQRLSRREGIEITTSASLRRRLSQLHEVTLYRVVQEALNNVARHSQASSARVLLRHRNGSIHCSIEDDGAGFDVEPVMERTAVEGLGLLGMRERVAALGGVVEIRSGRGKGTKITITLPGEG